MQYLKESVKQNIINSALIEFSKNGFDGTSMRKIAANAEIVSGNIYRYFKNKEDLFECAVGHVYFEIESLSVRIKDEILAAATDGEVFNADVLRKIVDIASEVVSTHGLEIYILLEKSTGTKYAGCKDDVKNIVFTTFKELFLPFFEKNGYRFEDDFIIKVAASSLVDGMSMIVSYGKSGADIKRVIARWMIVMLDNLACRLTKETF